jgi:hypothetical protein
MFGVETEIRKRPSLPLHGGLQTCGYSICPLLPVINKLGRDTIMSGSRSQLLPPLLQIQVVDKFSEH